MATWIERQFPAAVGRHRQTSEPDLAYNCVAFAAGMTNEWWSDVPGYKWPVARSPRAESLVAVFAGLGYAECDPADDEPGYERVAVYAKGGHWTHAARQLPSGKWTSKLGTAEDIEHDAPECLCGDRYGDVHCIMRQPRRQAPAATPGQ